MGGFAEMLGLGSLEKRKKMLESGASSTGLGSVPVKKKTLDAGQKKAVAASDKPKVDANKSVVDLGTKGGTGDSWEARKAKAEADRKKKYGF